MTPQVRKGLTGTGALAASIGVMLPLNEREEQGVRWVGYLLWEYLGTLACAQVAARADGKHQRHDHDEPRKAAAPVRVTIDQKICGNELPDEAIVVDAQGHLANAVVILTGVKRAGRRRERHA